MKMKIVLSLDPIYLYYYFLTKPGIIFIFLIFPAYFFLFYQSVRRDIIFYIIGFVIFLNCLSWISLETPFGNSISLFNPLNFRDYFYTLISASWFNNSLFFDYQIISLTIQFIIFHLKVLI